MTQHATVHYAADVVVVWDDRVMLIERKYPPYGKAIPGGHVDRDETSRMAAAREVREETGLHINPRDLHMVGVYDEPDRDPRYRMVSVAYVIELDQEPNVEAGDDAAAVDWYVIDDIIGEPLAFDHARILIDALDSRTK